MYGFKTIGLRYFNIFEQRQDPNGAYAAVIPKWFALLIKGEKVFINGDGETSRDFCYINNCMQANILAASSGSNSIGEVYNIAYGEQTTLNELFKLIQGRVAEKFPHALNLKPKYLDFRPGDVRHSLADITKARNVLGYDPLFSVRNGLSKLAEWYFDKLQENV